MRRRTVPILAVLAVAALHAPAAHAFRLPDPLPPLKGNPADRMLDSPIDPIQYDAARRCDPKAKPGVAAFTRWLQRNAAGVFWGGYRCERWGKRSASLHAENRAVDWHLDVAVPAERRHAAGLIVMLLAPDRLGNPHALARRMGVEEIIWDCSYWGAGMLQFKRYRPCFGSDGSTPRKRVNRTIAHRDHIHFGLSKAGAAGRTSFWRVG